MRELFLQQSHIYPVSCLVVSIVRLSCSVCRLTAEPLSLVTGHVAVVYQSAGRVLVRPVLHVKRAFAFRVSHNQIEGASVGFCCNPVRLPSPIAAAPPPRPSLPIPRGGSLSRPPGAGQWRICRYLYIFSCAPVRERSASRRPGRGQPVRRHCIVGGNWSASVCTVSC